MERLWNEEFCQKIYAVLLNWWLRFIIHRVEIHSLIAPSPWNERIFKLLRMK